MKKHQTEKALLFRELHQNPGIFFIGNPWDAGSARLLAQVGFQALATSSAAAAGSMGRKDGQITRDEAIAHAREIVAASELPVSGDLEDGFSHHPSSVAETIRLAGEAGLVGASIEDSSGEPGASLFEFSLAVERIAAAAEAARAMPFPFALTARAENFFRGVPDLDDAIKRLQAYERAGADVLFAPALPDLDAVRAVCSSVSKPVNFMVGIKGKSFTAAELQSAGVKRISFASSLYRAAMTGLLSAAREIKSTGTFEYLQGALTTPDLNTLLGN